MLILAWRRFALQITEQSAPILARHGLATRCGVHGGEVICGVLGGTKPHFDIWGDTVNMAPGALQQGGHYGP